MAIATVNPATGETVATFDALTDNEIELRLRRAIDAFAVNRARSFDERAQRMRRVAELLDERKESYGRLATIEMGKTLKAAVAEVQKCALVCRYYADHAAEMGTDVPEEPLVFLKPSTSVVGPGDPIMFPSISKRMEYEGELACVVGRLVREGWTITSRRVTIP